MKQIRSVATLMLLAAMVLTTTNSCMTTKTPVGEYQQQTGKEKTYSKTKQLWLFWGIVPIGRSHANTPDDGNCEVITKFNFTDVLISGLTAGIITSYTIKVKVKEPETIKTE